MTRRICSGLLAAADVCLRGLVSPPAMGLRWHLGGDSACSSAGLEPLLPVAPEQDSNLGPVMEGLAAGYSDPRQYTTVLS